MPVTAMEAETAAKTIAESETDIVVSLHSGRGGDSDCSGKETTALAGFWS